MDIVTQNKPITTNIRKLDPEWTFELDPNLKYEENNPVAKLFAKELQKEMCPASLVTASQKTSP